MKTGRYSQKINMDVWLKGHSGDEIRVDRKNRSAEYISNPKLTTVLAVQPSILEEIMTNRTMSGRGLIARFLISIPQLKIGKRIFSSQGMDNAIVTAFKELLWKILDVPLGTSVRTIKLSEQAHSIIESYFNENEILLMDKTSPMREWLAKNVGAVIRIAGILHIASDLEDDKEVSKETMEKAISIGQYFRSHVKYAYSVMGADDTAKKAEYVIGKLQKYKSSWVKRRDLFRDCRGMYFKNIADLKPTLDILEEYGYIRQESLQIERTNRPSEIIHINPQITSS